MKKQPVEVIFKKGEKTIAYYNIENNNRILICGSVPEENIKDVEQVLKEIQKLFNGRENQC